MTGLDPTIGYAAFEGRCSACSEPIIPGQRIRHVRTDARVIAGAYRPVIIFGHTHEHCDHVPKPRKEPNAIPHLQSEDT